MTRTSLASTLQDYAATLKSIETGEETPIAPQQVLQLLQTRDRVEGALIDPEQTATPDELYCLLELDQQLKQQVEKIVKVVNFADLRASLAVAPEKWWWNLDNLVTPHPQDRHDWLWKILSIGSWTATLALLVNIISRVFLPDPGLGGAAAIALPSILTLLQAKNELTSAGSEGFKQFLEKRGIPQHRHEEARLLFNVALSCILFGCWALLPKISERYS
jgi:hypothetical protein